MTKKATELVKKYEDKLDTQKWLVDKKFNTVDESLECVRSEKEDFQNLITSMFHYQLLNENDFKELMTIAYKMSDTYVDKILAI